MCVHTIVPVVSFIKCSHQCQFIPSCDTMLNPYFHRIKFWGDSRFTLIDIPSSQTGIRFSILPSYFRLSHSFQRLYTMHDEQALIHLLELNNFFPNCDTRNHLHIYISHLQTEKYFFSLFLSLLGLIMASAVPSLKGSFTNCMLQV